MLTLPYLKIRKRSQPIWLILFIIFYPFTFGTLIDFLGLPSSIKYLIDIAWISLIVLTVMNLNRKKIAIQKKHAFIYIYVLLFFLTTLIVYTFNYQSIFYYLWGVRNNFRFYIAFFACILFLEKDDIEEFLSAFDVLFWINSFICLIQYFVFDIKQDNLGGLFGVEKGCNGYLNIFLVIIVTKSIIYYLNKLENVFYLLLKGGTALIIATLAELKFFYIEFIIIILVAIFISDFSLRKLWVVISGIVGVFLAIQLLDIIFPNFFNYFSINNIIEDASQGGYSSQEALNRLTTVPIISNEFLETNSEKIFGLGLGNCDTSTYDFLQTPFYIEFSYLRYQWFSTAFLLLETGFLGLIFYFGFFVSIFYFSIKFQKDNAIGAQNKVFYQIAAIISVLSILITIYNSSLRGESGYMIYFILSIPFIIHKKWMTQNE